MASPTSSYIVCATPRSGSGQLRELLTATGVAGRPEEFFAHLHATESAEAFEQHLSNSLRDATTENGVWGTELHWGSLLDLLHRLKERAPTAAMHSPEAIEAIAPDPHYVQVQRRDKQAQATEAWTDSEPHSHSDIARLREQLVNQERAWTRWFAGIEVQPHVVVYEDLIDNPDAVVTGLLRELQIDTFGAVRAAA